MPDNQLDETIYDDIGEVLHAPPSGIVRYGISVISAVVLVVIALLLLVKYTDGYRFSAVLQAPGNQPVYSGKEATQIMLNRVVEGALVKREEVLLVTRETGKTANDTIRAKSSGKLVLLRKLREGQFIPAGVPLFLTGSDDKGLQARLFLSREAASFPFKLGQRIRFQPKNGSEDQELEGEVVSLPYTIKGGYQAVVDIWVDQQFLQKADGLFPFTQLEGEAFIPTGRRALLARIFQNR